MNNEQLEIISKLKNTLYIIEEEMETQKRYKKFINEIVSYLCAGFEEKELRECPVYFKFHNDKDQEEAQTIYTLQLRHFLTNLMFWKPLIKLDSVEFLNEDFLVDPKRLSSGYIESYINTKIVIPYRKKISNRRMNKILHDLIHDLASISNEFNPILGLKVFSPAI